jgi:Pyruvate/2-oxoacid:ferredoxin oxidoreductase gamma subunit
MNRIEAVNDFVVKFANVNGSGSASANELFAKAVLRMGVPVAPRNIFPSNIQGLPTWYEVRVTEAGWLGRRGGIDMMVAMNPQTWAQDLAEVEPGGYLFYDSTRPMPESAFRRDINVIAMPVTAICNATYEDPRQRTLFKNIMVLGALSVLMDIDPAVIEQLFGEQYRGKERLLESNVRALQSGRSFARTTCRASACACAGPTRWATASSSRATPPRRWAACTVAPRCAPGTRSRPVRRWPRPSRSTARSSASTPPPASATTPSCRPRTRSPASAWSPAPAGTAHAPSPPPRAPACR